MRALIAVFLIVPLFAIAQSDPQAQIDALLTQIAALQQQLASMSGTYTVPLANTPSCPTFSRTLQHGSQGDDVRELQKILISGGYLHAEATGFFGALTEKALQDFQAKSKIISNGTPATTGWGVLGPKTRAFLHDICSKQLVAVAPPTNVCPAFTTPQPSEACAGIWQKLRDAKGCEIGWKCILSPIANTTNKPPTIEAVSGPTSLVAGETGVWDILARDPEGGALQYSVIWGDEGAGSILEILAGISNPTYTNAPRHMHTYTLPGRYTIDANVRDSVGNIAASTFSVLVMQRSSTTPISTTPVAAAPLPGSCQFAGASYPEGTVTEGYGSNDLCIATNGVCQNRTSYIPSFKCTSGAWREALSNPFPNLPNYASLVGTQCAPTGTMTRGATKQAVVHPDTQLCRSLLCATAQNYAPVTLTCEYETWVDWGIFYAGATTTTICVEPTACEYGFGQGGRACAPKVNGTCPMPQTNHPLGT